LSFLNPLRDEPTILVTAVGEAEGARAASAALACAGASADDPSLLIDVGGRPARPALLASAAAQKLEQRLTAHLPELRPAARGEVCHLAVPVQPDRCEAVPAAIAVARGSTAVVHLPARMFQPALEGELGFWPSAVLLRADLARDRPLVALTVRELKARGVDVAVLKRRLSWVAERRALFGALPAGAPGGLPERLVRRLGDLSRDRAVPVQAMEAAS
jgi:hypothetical protein